MNWLRSNCWLTRGLGTGLVLMFLAAVVHAQAPMQAGDMPAIERAKAASESGLEAEPSIYMLPGEDGKLQAVLNFKLEDFEALLDLQRQQGMATEPPEYALSMKAEGEALANSVKLTVQFDVETKSDAWTRIPLNLDEGVLVAESQYTGEGDFFLAREKDAQGFVAWIRADANSKHEITLDMRLPVSQLGGDTRLRMTVPETVVSSLELIVDSPGVVARVSDDSVLDTETIESDESTRFEVQGLRNNFELAWRVPAVEDTTAPTLLQASGELLATVDGRTITTEARLMINSFGDSSFDSFRVKLPPGSHLVPGQRPGYTVVEVTPGNGDQEIADREVGVQLDEARSDAIEILLVTERPHDAANEPEPIELAGFDVVGAVRQTGYIAVEALGDWQVLWEGQRNVRRVETVPESLARDGLIAGFEYLGQPCSLTARIQPRETLIGVDPNYLLEVDDDQVSLTATLKYTIRGAKAFALEVDIEEWEIDELGPHSVVDSKGVVLDKRSPLSIPLLQPLTGEQELTIKAHRLLDEDATEIDVPLPRPRVTSLGPAKVQVVAAENVVLLPKPDEIVGLSRNTAQPAEQGNSRQQRTLLYRGDTRPARFVADFRVESRSVSVESSALLSVDREGVTVTQALDYDVRYESLEQIGLNLPPGLADGADIEVVLDGQPLVAATSPIAVDRESTVAVAYDLGEPRLGEFQIQLRYVQPWEQLPREASVARLVPLVMPNDGTLSENEVLVDIDPGIELTPRDGAWELEPYVSADLAARRPVRFRAEGAVSEFELVLSLKDLRPYGSAFVDKAWIQSWIDGQWRHDRAVFWVTSPSDSLVVHLPAGSRTADVQVKIDGVETSPKPTPDARLELVLPRGESNTHHLVELNYRVAKTSDGWGRLSLEPPMFDEPLWVRRTYWQVVLPETRHLFSSSGPYSGEFAWTWNGMGWSRAPLAEQPDLEEWIGTSHAAAMPRGSNRYLFSTLGTPEPLETVTIGRGWMVLLVGGSVLLLALLTFYIPEVRHPGLAMAGAVLLLAGAWLQPDLAFIVVQIAILALVFVVVGLLIQRWLQRRKVPQYNSRFRGSSIVEMGSTDRQYRQSVPVVTSSSSTHTQSVSAGSSSAGPEL